MLAGYPIRCNIGGMTTTRRSFLRALGLGAVAAPFLPDVMKAEPAPVLTEYPGLPRRVGYSHVVDGTFESVILGDGGPWTVPSGATDVAGGTFTYTNMVRYYETRRDLGLP